jgi:hypothetical protein
MPETVQMAYKNLLDTMSENPSTLAVSVRKLLEAICDDYNAIGTNLSSKMRWMLNTAVVPQRVFDLLDVLRKFGNAGAHGNYPLSYSDSTYLSEAARLILDYCYGLAVMERQLRARSAQLNI